MSPSAETSTSTSTESIALRAFALLESIVESSGPMSLDALTSALHLPKPTVYRILHLMMNAGLVRREVDGKRYTIGPRLTSFAVNLWRSDALRVQWHRALQDAVDEIGESCNLTLLENNQVLYLDRVETAHPLRLHLEAGTRVPLHCTASGKLFLSRMTDEEARRALGPEPYERFTAKTITAFAPLAAELAKVRKTGIGTHDSERFDDSVAIAVPVLASDGSIVMAVAMHAPSSRASLKTCMGYVGALQRAAGAIAGTLGRPPAAAKKTSRSAARG
ncbi:IclR family transcriptional regulator [Variovorax sp. RA8]|uniref:IclR family transcriptional regulator n=1 Tax=Variovorax sp. (strain JCM 16519 / RA8) TaxID=662548 RepID=UPI0013176D57|nr:IclR family transcriptional regulator [Variovorax sp. RA8]VTU27428.1 Transcriptional regulator KdgR [Variovorax sp. RA8]